MPHEYGSTTPSTPAAVTAASTALPPWRSTRMAASVAALSTVAAAPPVPSAVGTTTCRAGWACTAAGTANPAQIVRTASVVDLRMKLAPPRGT